MNEAEQKQVADIAASAAAAVVQKMQAEQREEMKKLIAEVDAASAKRWDEHVKAREAEAKKAGTLREVPSVQDTALAGAPKQKKSGREPNFATKLAHAIGIAKQHQISVEKAADNLGYQDVAKGLNTSTNADGGYLVQDTVSSEDFIEFLRSKTVLTDIPTIPIKGKLELGRMNSGASVSWVADGSAATISKPQFNRVSLSEHKVIGAVPVSNSVIRDSIYELDVLVNNDLLSALLGDIDAKAIRGDGTSNTTSGLKSLLNASNKFSAAGASVAQIISDLAKCEQLIDEGNLPSTNKRIWLISPRTRASLFSLVNANGVPVFQAEMMRGTILGREFRVTTSIPRNLTVNATSNTSEIYLVDVTQCRRGVGMDGMYALKAYDGATYFDGTSQVNGVLTDETLFRAIAAVDFAIRYDTCGAFIDTVTY